MQAVPKRLVLVTTARAESRVTDSSRGLASKLSPTHKLSKTLEPSALSASSSSSGTVVAPNTTPWLGSSRPSFIGTFLLRFEGEEKVYRVGQFRKVVLD